MKSKLIFPLLLLGFSSVSYGQNILYNDATINSSGSKATLNEGSFEWSIGEMALVHTATAPNIIVTQGLLQPIDNNSTGVTNPSLTRDDLLIYPNPSTDQIFIETKFNKRATLSYYLYTVTGQKIVAKNFESHTGKDKILINLSGYASGSYLLVIKTNINERNYENHFNIKKIQ